MNYFKIGLLVVAGLLALLEIIGVTSNIKLTAAAVLLVVFAFFL